MNVLGLLGSRLNTTARSAAGWFLLAISTTCGCAEEPVEKAPADIEKARQEHIETMRREAGESAAAEKG
jgi:hypothetical protein